MNKAMVFSDPQTRTFYKVAGTLALCIVLAGIIDAVTSMGNEARANSTVSMMEWFNLFQTNRFAAFSSLGLINILTLSLSIPIYVAFTQVYRQSRPALATLASLFFFIGTTVYLSSNTVFSMFAISQQAAAAPAAQRPLLEAAGRALLAQGADLTPGTFFGLFFTQIAGLLITTTMLRGEVFGKWTGWAGLAGNCLMTVFFILTAFFPELYHIALLIAAPGALIMLAYEIMLARRFYQLGK
ncbi:MAG TPA: DUF4386 family protein [Anaerolineales bacterium]